MCPQIAARALFTVTASALDSKVGSNAESALFLLNLCRLWLGAVA